MSWKRIPSKVLEKRLAEEGNGIKEGRVYTAARRRVYTAGSTLGIVMYYYCHIKRGRESGQRPGVLLLLWSKEGVYSLMGSLFSGKFKR